jgi:hypothetical protein
MTNQMTQIKIVLYAILSVVIVLNAFLFLDAPKASSAVSDNLTGYAWSDTIGWISFNSTNEAGPTSDYGVSVASNGDMTGYAWSEHIGWISFNETTGCPSGVCAPNFNKVTGVVTGWARALSACQDDPATPTSSCPDGSAGAASGGWDGWISLSGTTADSGTYGVVVTGTDWEGYAWGSDVVGWISFGGTGYGVTGTNDDSTQISAAVVTDFRICDADGVSNCFTEGQEKIVAPSTPLSISWNSSSATACDAVSGTGFDTGASRPTSGTDNAVSTSVQDTSENYTIRCSNGGNALTIDTATVEVTTTQVILSASPRTVESGSSATLSWNIGLMGDEAACTLSGGTIPAGIMASDTTVGTSAVEATSGTYVIPSVTARTTYTVTCGALVDTETIDVVPVGTET